MANKRSIKRNIKVSCMELFAECVAISLYGAKKNEANIAALLNAIIKLEDDYIHRVSHIEPGMKAKVYFKDLNNKFYNQVAEIIDQMNYLN